MGEHCGAASGAATNAPTKPTKMESIVADAANNLIGLQQIEHRLNLLLDRLQGPRPKGVDDNKNKDVARVTGALYRLGELTIDARETLSRVFPILDEISGLV